MLHRFLVLILSLACFVAHAQPPLGIRLQQYDYPYPVYYKHSIVEGLDVSLAYMDVHPAAPNGATILLLHGKNFPAAYWQQTIRALSAAGFRVVAPDALGFGKSSKPVVQYSFSLLAALTKEILDSLHISKVSVVGHSMGGMLAVRFTLSYPQMVGRLVLEDALGLEDWRSKGVPYRKVDEWYKEEQAATYASIKQYHQTSYYPVWRPEFEEWIHVQYGMKAGGNRSRIDWVNALTYDMIFNQPVVHEFSNIKVPTLIVIGKKDKTKLARGAGEEVSSKLGHYPELGRAAANAIPGARFIEYPETGHVPHLEIPETFHRDLIGFLR